ncbi:hypothetical protein GRI69_02250 [Erythrobacter vulgaris]|uniref:Sulfotransferase family protein n=1 Tax=Qipengyuania vulgaris TaxID=291985 RepID=A0A844XPB3_9SPHN|nr:sulfotransferase family protein [Qipengyuania vulgaris]MXO47083.1 hypothetical protein [Qipengyuania vulgaris]
MISHEHKAVFVHVPKVAGQSVELVFLDLLGLSWEQRAPLVLRHNPDPARGPERLAHLLAREYVELGYIDQVDFDAYFKFAFVRNPWARLVSEYEYRRREKRPFAEFVEAEFASIDDYSDHSRHIIPQSDYIYDSNGEPMLDYVGRFETLSRDFRKVADRLKLGVETLPRKNVSGMGRLQKLFRSKPKEKKPFQEYYDARLRDRVGEFYRRDIEHFGYSFDGSFRDEPIVGSLQK